MLDRISKRLRSLHRDERGADMVEYILIIAAIALPLLAVILWFRNDISQWAKELWEGIKTGDVTDPDEL